MGWGLWKASGTYPGKINPSTLPPRGGGGEGRQTNTLQDRIDTKVRQTDFDQQARHLLVIFENFEATVKNFLRTTVTVSKVCKEVKMGISLQQYGLVVGMHWSALCLFYWWQHRYPRLTVCVTYGFHNMSKCREHLGRSLGLEIC